MESNWRQTLEAIHAKILMHIYHNLNDMIWIPLINDLEIDPIKQAITIRKYDSNDEDNMQMHIKLCLWKSLFDFHIIESFQLKEFPLSLELCKSNP